MAHALLDISPWIIPIFTDFILSTYQTLQCKLSVGIITFLSLVSSKNFPVNDANVYGFILSSDFPSN